MENVDTKVSERVQNRRKALIQSSATQEAADPLDCVNNQFLMDSSNSESSIDSISKSLSSIPKKKLITFSKLRNDIQEELANAQKEFSSGGIKAASATDQAFKESKDLLFNLSNNSLETPGSALYSQMQAIRNSIVNYQRKTNIYVETYDFISLLTTILLLSGKALHCVVQISISLLPLFEIAIHVSRFIVEQLVVIHHTHSRRERLKCSLLCFLQSSALILVTMFIYGSVLLPIFYIGLSIFWKLGRFLLF